MLNSHSREKGRYIAHTTQRSQSQSRRVCKIEAAGQVHHKLIWLYRPDACVATCRIDQYLIDSFYNNNMRNAMRGPTHTALG